ncbi:unnamed protein product [Chrysoparadoxa australica]
MRRRVLNVPHRDHLHHAEANGTAAVQEDGMAPTSAPRARIGVLFSGGLDCVVLAALLAEDGTAGKREEGTHGAAAQGEPLLPYGTAIDLLNVCFDKVGGHLSPDRMAAIAAVEELAAVFPRHHWRLICIDASYDEVAAEHQRLSQLLHPCSTVMDLNIGAAFWMAASGKGRVYKLGSVVAMEGCSSDREKAGRNYRRGSMVVNACAPNSRNKAPTYLCGSCSKRGVSCEDGREQEVKSDVISSRYGGATRCPGEKGQSGTSPAWAERDGCSRCGCVGKGGEPVGAIVTASVRSNGKGYQHHLLRGDRGPGPCPVKDCQWLRKQHCWLGLCAKCCKGVQRWALEEGATASGPPEEIAAVCSAEECQALMSLVHRCEEGSEREGAPEAIQCRAHRRPNAKRSARHKAKPASGLPAGSFLPGSYTSQARVLLTGIGADEQLGGYTRHRDAYNRGGEEAMMAVLASDTARLWQRNLGRDDRCVSDRGKEARYPYLDEGVMTYIRSLPPRAIANMEEPPGFGDKQVLRLVAKQLGLEGCTALVKRAIQFGSRIAKAQATAGYQQQRERHSGEASEKRSARGQGSQRFVIQPVGPP